MLCYEIAVDFHHMFPNFISNLLCDKKFLRHFDCRFGSCHRHQTRGRRLRRRRPPVVVLVLILVIVNDRLNPHTATTITIDNLTPLSSLTFLFYRTRACMMMRHCLRPVLVAIPEKNVANFRFPCGHVSGLHSKAEQTGNCIDSARVQCLRSRSSLRSGS